MGPGMKIRELQERIKDHLNGIEDLVRKGCKAFAEDTRSVYDESAQWIASGKVALVVVTPEMSRNGCTANGIAAETSIIVRCIEKAPLAKIADTLRALDAAEIVMHALDSSSLYWQSTRQTSDKTARVFTTSVTFSTSVTLSE